MTTLGMHLYTGTTKYPMDGRQKEDNFISLSPVIKDEDGKYRNVSDYCDFGELYNFCIKLTHYTNSSNFWHLFRGYEHIYSIERSNHAEKILRVLKRIENAFQKHYLENGYSMTEAESIGLIMKVLRVKYVIFMTSKRGFSYDENEYETMTPKEAVERIEKLKAEL